MSVPAPTRSEALFPRAAPSRRVALDLTAAQPIPLLVATVAQAALGAAWFGAFAKPWAAVAFPGKTRQEIQAGPKWPYAVAVVAALVTAYGLGVLMEATGATEIGPALGLAALSWVALVAAAFATTYAFQWKPVALLSIDAGYHLARMLVAAAILSLWP